MELDELKSEWNTVKPFSKTNEAILLMLQENRHPVLKAIRKQIIIELIGWSLFLVCYYTMFDGGNKPFFINIVLIFAVAFPMVHHLYGYHFNKYLIDGSNIKSSLEKYLNRMKAYASLSLISRVLFVSGLLLFFTYSIHFTASKYYLLTVIILVFLIQLFFLYRIWAKRLQELKNTINAFSVNN
jgi:hypothetical protein